MLTPYPRQCPNIPFHLGPEWWTQSLHEAQFQRLVGPGTRNIIEIGSFVGRSTLAWLRMAPNATIWCIDPWDGSLPMDDQSVYSQHHPQAPIWEQFVKNTWHVQDRVRMFRETLATGIEQVSRHLTMSDWPDLIYIDGDHAKGTVISDIELSIHWLAHPTKTIICGDDFTWTGVREALDELLTTKQIKGYQAVSHVWVLDK